MNIKQRLANGEKLLGPLVGLFDNADIPVILKEAGYDYFFIDSEHGYIDFNKMAAMVTVAKSIDMPVIIRIPQLDREIILKYMEMGADGLLMPNTDTAMQAEALVEYSKYAPLGNRGVSLLKAHTKYHLENAVEYMQKANNKTILLVQIESSTGVENVEAIMKVEGIDAAFVGPFDLSQSMGIIGEFDRPEFIEAIEKVISCTKKEGKYCGLYMVNPVELKKWAKKGMSINLCSSDVGLLIDAAKQHIKLYRD